MQACYAQIPFDAAPVIERLFDTIASSPQTSSNPLDYMEAHPLEVRELTYYGASTLRYIFGEFLQGGQTGLKGQLMESVLKQLAPDEMIRFHSGNGQEYFDEWLATVREERKAHDEAWMRDFCPAGLLLLQMEEETETAVQGDSDSNHAAP